MKNLRYYFRLFGNPDYPSDNYWEQDPVLGQILLGILFAPFAIVIYCACRLLSIRIKL